MNKAGSAILWSRLSYLGFLTAAGIISSGAMPLLAEQITNPAVESKFQGQNTFISHTAGYGNFFAAYSALIGPDANCYNHRPLVNNSALVRIMTNAERSFRDASVLMVTFADGSPAYLITDSTHKTLVVSGPANGQINQSGSAAYQSGSVDGLFVISAGPETLGIIKPYSSNAVKTIGGLFIPGAADDNINTRLLAGASTLVAESSVENEFHPGIPANELDSGYSSDAGQALGLASFAEASDEHHFNLIDSGYDAATFSGLDISGGGLVNQPQLDNFGFADDFTRFTGIRPAKSAVNNTGALEEAFKVSSRDNLNNSLFLNDTFTFYAVSA